MGSIPFFIAVALMSLLDPLDKMRLPSPLRLSVSDPHDILISMTRKSSLPTRTGGAGLVPWKNIAAFKSIKLGKNSKAAVVMDDKGAPRLFVFDTPAFLDVLSEIDEALVDKLSNKEYHSKTSNPAGWLIDEIESRLPLNQKFVISLKKAVEEAKRLGWIPFSELRAKPKF